MRDARGAGRAWLGALLTVVLLGALGAGARAEDPPAFPASCSGFLKTGRTKLGALFGSYRWKHSEAVTAIAFSPDGRKVLAGDAASQVVLWDAATGGQARSVGSHGGQAIQFVAFSPGGHRAASTGVSGQVALWDLSDKSKVTVKNVAGHAGGTFTIAFSPDGTHVITGGADNTLKVWDVETGALVATWGGFEDVPEHPADNEGGHWVVPAQRVFTGHHGRVLAASYSPDGAWVLSGGTGERSESSGKATTKDTLILWNAASGRIEKVLDGHDSAVHAVAFSPDGTRAFSAGNDSTVKVWDLAKGKCVRTIRAEGAIHGFAVAPDGKRVYAGVEPYTGSTAPREKPLSIQGWDVASGREVLALRGLGLVGPLDVSLDGQRLAFASGREVWIWDLEKNARVRPPEGHDGSIRAVAVSPDGKELASGSEDGTVRLWDTATTAELQVWRGHQGVVSSVAFAKDGTRVLSGSWDKTARVWDVASGKCTSVLKHPDGVWTVALAPDAKTALTGGGDKLVRVWDVESGKVLATLAGHREPITAVAFSPDGTRALSASEDRTLKLWDLAKGEALTTLVGHESKVLSCTFTPDGRHALSGSDDKTVIVWDLETGSEARRLQGFGASVSEVHVSPDGKLVAALTGQTTLWDLATGKQVDEIGLGSASDSTWSLDFAPDGKSFVVGTRLGVILRFDLHP